MAWRQHVKHVKQYRRKDSPWADGCSFCVKISNLAWVEVYRHARTSGEPAISIPEMPNCIDCTRVLLFFAQRVSIIARRDIASLNYPSHPMRTLWLFLRPFTLYCPLIQDPNLPHHYHDDPAPRAGQHIHSASRLVFGLSSLSLT